MNRTDIEQYKIQVQKELKEDILRLWIDNLMDKENGGYYGAATNDLKVNKQADKGCILNSRILWTYSIAYRLFKDENYLNAAKSAYDFMLKYFWDKEYSGLYWMVNYKGEAVETKKQIYNIAFGIYGLSEYYRATGDKQSLKKAVELYEIIEKFSYDDKNKGYLEAFTRDWEATDDMRLGGRGFIYMKSMNNHLHVLEAYTNLYRVWNNDGLKRKLRELINVTIDHIINHNTWQFRLYFDECWNSLSGEVSYGHDIEGSWLLYEAAEVLGDEELLEKVKDISVKMAEKVYKDGIDKEFGGLLNEMDEQGKLDEIKAWWPQAEAAVGFLNAYELTGEQKYLKESNIIWQYIERYFLDKKYGEWFNEITRDGKAIEKLPKVSPWKCPYHNARACFEVTARLNRLIE